MSTSKALLRIQSRMEGQESTSSTQEAEKTESTLLLASTPQTTKLKQKSCKQLQPTLKSAALVLPTMLSLQTPCPSCRPFSQTEMQTTTTYPLLLPPFAEAMQLPCSLPGNEAANSGKGRLNKRANGYVYQLPRGEDHPKGQAAQQVKA